MNRDAFRDAADQQTRESAAAVASDDDEVSIAVVGLFEDELLRGVDWNDHVIRDPETGGGENLFGHANPGHGAFHGFRAQGDRFTTFVVRWIEEADGG